MDAHRSVTRICLRAAPASAAQARQFLREVLSGWCQDVVEVVLLLTSEVVTNAVVHASSDVELIVGTGPDGVRVEVHDADSKHLPVLREGRSFDERGRGLLLVAELAVRWGAQRDGSGKCVWFEVGSDIDLRAVEIDLRAAVERATGHSRSRSTT